jgi:hypothetical protein
MDSMWQSDVARYDYALCHGCGVVYATRRPERTEYEFLYQNFHEFLLREPKTTTLSVPALTPDKAKEIDDHFIPWWDVRSDATPKSRLRKLLRRELDNVITYAPYIMLHVPLQGAKVLHIRAKSSTFADFMKRVLGAAQVDLITLFPAHTYLAQKNGAYRAASCLDFENFTIPFDERYDLIIENHIFIHMMDPDRTLGMFAEHLEENGSIFLQSEIDDTMLYLRRKNLFAELRPFHFFQYDVPALHRMLRRYGFEPKNVGLLGDKSEVVGVATKSAQAGAEFQRISEADLQARLDLYRRWRDESILALPKDRCEALFGNEMKDVWKRVNESGGVLAANKANTFAVREFREANLSLDQLAVAAAPLRTRLKLILGPIASETSWSSIKNAVFRRILPQRPRGKRPRPKAAKASQR